MRKGLKVLLITDSFVTLAFGLLGPIYAIFVENIGGDILDASGAWAAFLFATGIMTFFISRWEDHVKHQEKIMALSYLILAIGVLGYLFVETSIHLFIVQIVLGVGQAFNNPTYNGLYSRLLDKGRYVSEWGLWDSMSCIVTSIAALIGGAVATFYGFKALFLIMFVFSIISFLASISLLRAGNRKL